MTTEAELQTMPIDDLASMAKDLGLKVPKKADKLQLVNIIVQATEGTGPAEGDGADETPEDVEAKAEAQAAAKEAALAEERQAMGELAQDEEELDTGGNYPAEPAPATHTAKQLASEAVLPAGTGQEYATPETLKKALAPLIRRGLQIRATNKDFWVIAFHNREAAGTMHQPLKVCVAQANILARPTKQPTEK